MFPFSEIKIAAKTARREREAEAIAGRTADSIQQTQLFYEFASRQFRRGSVLVGILAVGEGMRVEFGRDNLAMGGIACGLGALTILANRRNALGNSEAREFIHELEPAEIVAPPAVSPATT